MLNDFGQLILILLFVGLGIFLLWFFIFKVKHLKTPDVFLVDGGVKTGKSLVSVMLAIKQYRKNLFRYYVGNVLIRFLNLFKRLFKRELKPLIVKPMLYSNMPLYKVKYNYLSDDILTLKKRIPYRSVVLLDEASLIADSMTAFGNVKNRIDKQRMDYINEKLTIFLKVFISHGCHGSTCIYNSQNVVDLHFAFRRNTGTYLYIQKNRKFPFFCLLDVRELVHDESNDVVNTYQGDVDDVSKPLFVWKRWYKYYDRYYLDVLFKELPVMVNYDVKPLNPRLVKQELKHVLTFGQYKSVLEFNEAHKEIDNNA